MDNLTQPKWMNKMDHTGFKKSVCTLPPSEQRWDVSPQSISALCQNVLLGHICPGPLGVVSCGSYCEYSLSAHLSVSLFLEWNV